MAIFRGTGGSGNSTDDSIVSAVTEQAGIATTKASEAEGFRDEAEGFKNTASSKANLATTKANEASVDAAGADSQRQLCVGLKLETYDLAQEALASANAAEASAQTANNTHVQTVSGIATEVQNLDSIKTDITGVNTIKSDVTTVAGISSNVTTVAADASDIGTVATNIANVNNVGDNISNVNSVAGNATNINTVAGDASDIGTVSSNISNVNTVAGISSDVTTVAGLESKMDTVIADASDIGAVAGNIGDVTTVAGINSEVDTVAGISAKVTTVADNIADVQNADTNAANASASASQAANSATAASASATTASTKATEASNSATAASNSATTATTKATEAAGSATTATNKATEASTSATNAATSATTATTKAGEAASSATAASGSATTATTKAAEADASATSAATSATDASNAENAWSSFYATYLGSYSAPPTVDVQGNALQTGAFYYDTGAGSNTVGLYVYNGSSWVYSTNYNNVTAPYSLSQDLATNSHDISFGDNAKALFGASDDLQIYHDGSNSYVKDTGTGYLILGNSDAGTIIKNGSGQNLLTTTASEIRLGHEGNTKLATKSTGIDVTGTVTADGLDVGTSTSGIINLLRPSTNYIRANETGGSLVAGVRENIRFCTGQASGDFLTNERMRITSSGRVGIGTTSPAQKLDVNGTIAADSAIFGTTSDAQTIVYVTSSTTGESEIRLGDTDTDAGSIAYNNADNSMQFRANAAERLRIDSSGKVGIGTTSPSAPLHVKSATDAIFRLESSDSNAWNYMEFQGNTARQGWIGSDNNNAIQINADNASKILLSGGNVGIGTTSPATQLHVSGTSPVLRLTDSDTGAHSQINASSSLGALQIQADALNAVAGSFIGFTVDGSEKARINESGNVGIGTSTPASPLHVNSGATDIAATLESSDSAVRLSFAESGSTGNNHISLQSNEWYIYSNSTERMRIDSSGNVGIGTSSPSALLDVTAGNILAGGKGVEISGNTSYIADGSYGTSLDITHNYQSNDGSFRAINIDLTDSGTNNQSLYGLYVNAENNYLSGNVGIGTTSPDGKLHVYTSDSGATVNSNADEIVIESSGSAGLSILGTGDENQYIMFGDTANSSIGRLQYSHIDNHMGFYTSGSERMRIDSSGNLLVGTTQNDVGYTDSGAGFAVSPLGFAQVARSSASSLLYLNKLDNDGSIIGFYKDGTTIGSIGTVGGDSYFQHNGTGIRLWDGNEAITPCGAGGATADGTRSLGASEARFKDLYLSGGVHLGGTGNANKLDDYEEGTWTPTALNYDGTLTVDSATYVKVGALVTVKAKVTFDATVDGSGVNISSLPFVTTGVDKANGGFIVSSTVSSASRMKAIGTGSLYLVAADDSNVSYTTMASTSLEFVMIYESTV